MSIFYYSLEEATDRLEEISRANTTIHSEDGLCQFVLFIHARSKGADEMDLPLDHPLPGLRAALRSLRDRHGVDDPIRDLLPRILRHAQDLRRLFPDGHIGTLPRGRAKSLSLTAGQVSCLVANAAFCNLGRIPLPDLTSEQNRALRETIPHYGSLSPHLWFQSETVVARERTTALLLYLHAVTDPIRERSDANRNIEFKRATAHNLPRLPSTIHDSTSATVSVEFVHQQGIEAIKLAHSEHIRHARMDFANATLHVGALWPTATQEEILFSAYPECLVGVLFCETMADRDAIVISNVRRFISSTGFAERYRVQGLVSCPEGNDANHEMACIVAVDAAIPETLAEQLRSPLIRRDVGKAAAAWTASGKSVIVTGNWGTGAFGGNIYAKFLHQYLAASRCSIYQAGDIQLRYCLTGMDSAVQEQNMRRLEKWARAVYAQGGEAAVVAKLETLTRDSNGQDDWPLEEKLLQLPESGD